MDTVDLPRRASSPPRTLAPGVVSPATVMAVSEARTSRSTSPAHDGEQEARRQPAHQHANDAFHWTQGPPSLRKNDIAVANGRIAGSREEKGRIPRCKTKPTIKARPKQNLQKVQANERRHQSHHEHGGTDRP